MNDDGHERTTGKIWTEGLYETLESEAARMTSRLVACQMDETGLLLRMFQASDARKSALIDAARKVAVIATDKEGAVICFNKGAENLLGWKSADVVGKASPDIFFSREELSRRASMLEGYRGKELSGPSLFFEYARMGPQCETGWTCIRKDKSRFPAGLSVSCLPGVGEGTGGLLLVVMDITAQKMAEQEILEAMRATDEISRTKSIIIENMSHELRTPLNAIIGYSEMLHEESEGLGLSGMAEGMKKISGAGKHLLALVNDILDLTRLEAGKMPVSTEWLDVECVVREVAAMAAPLVLKNRNRLVVDCPPGTGSVRTDTVKLRQVLFNLLSNSSRFTEDGTITLDVTRMCEHGEEFVQFRVTDTGAGMTPARQSSVFRAFTDSNIAIRKDGNTGLGLAISRLFCNMMGGDLYVSSEHGKGSTFTASIRATDGDAAVPDTDQTGHAVQSDQTRHIDTIMVIDEDKAGHGLLLETLRREGLNVIAVESGQGGMRLARQLSPTAILLGENMTSTDGTPVINELKSDPDTRDIPVIMMTMADDSGASESHAAIDRLTKPVDVTLLLGLLSGLRSSDDAAVETLVVEDDRINRELLCEMLQSAGVRVCEAENGLDALTKMESAKPSMILLDLVMPKMDGFEFVEKLRRNRDWSDIPVLVLTARDVSDEDRSRLKGNVVDILKKGSFSRDDLVNYICGNIGKPGGLAMDLQGGTA